MRKLGESDLTKIIRSVRAEWELIKGKKSCINCDWPGSIPEIELRMSYDPEELFYELPPVTISKIAKITNGIMEVAESSLIPRSYVPRYGLSTDKFAYESVAAHTNLMKIILDRALGLEYPHEMTHMHQIEGYWYREIMEAANRHDLPENVIGDIPDNGNRNNSEAKKFEDAYWSDYSRNCVYETDLFEENVMELLEKMESKKTKLGRMLYLADKVSAIIITLTYINAGRIPKIDENRNDLSKLDKTAIEIASSNVANEMWTVDYLKIRHHTKYDDTGIFTAILIAATISVYDDWYYWREKDYK